MYDTIAIVTDLSAVAVRQESLLIVIGSPYSGKSSFSARFAPTQVVCLDTLRGMVADDEADQSATPAALALGRALLNARCARRLFTVFDATNTVASRREWLLQLGKDHELPVHALVFDVPAHVCQARRAHRPRVVPAEVVTAFAAEVAELLTHPHTLLDEGFASVTIYRPNLSEMGYRS